VSLSAKRWRKIVLKELGNAQKVRVGRLVQLTVRVKPAIMNGYATIRAIRNLRSCRDLPILAVTANVTPGERQRCIDAGACEYIPKPVDTNGLMIALGQCLASAAPAGRPPVSPR
jgi:CheY-like chemotaxis protein